MNRSRCLACVAGVFLATVARSAMSADWPQWLGPTRGNVTTEVVPAWTEPPPVVWRQSVGGGQCQPVVADGLVFVHAVVPDKQAESVVAFDAISGEERWRDTYDRSTYRSAVGTGPRATPVVSRGKLYAFGITGMLTAYEAASGKRLWQVDTHKLLGSETPRFGACSSPIVVGNRVVVPIGGSGCAVVGFDTESGEVAWKSMDEPAASSSPVLLSANAAEVGTPDVVVQSTLRLVGLSPLDGAIRWEHPLVFQPNGVTPTPLVTGRHVICSTQDVGTVAIEVPASGESPTVAWQKPELGAYFSTGAVTPAGLIVVTNVLMPLPRADLRCVDLETGEELWRKDGAGYFHVGVMATGDGRLLSLDDAGNLVLAEVTREGYNELSRAKACGGTFINPVLVDGRAYLRDGKEVVCLDLRGEAKADAPVTGS